MNDLYQQIALSAAAFGMIWSFVGIVIAIVHKAVKDEGGTEEGTKGGAK